MKAPPRSQFARIERWKLILRELRGIYRRRVYTHFHC